MVLILGCFERRWLPWVIAAYLILLSGASSRAIHSEHGQPALVLLLCMAGAWCSQVVAKRRQSHSCRKWLTLLRGLMVGAAGQSLWVVIHGSYGNTSRIAPAIVVLAVVAFSCLPWKKSFLAYLPLLALLGTMVVFSVIRESMHSWVVCLRVLLGGMGLAALVLGYYKCKARILCQRQTEHESVEPALP
jgi:hypothetical protein